MSSLLIEQLLALPGRWRSVPGQQALFHRGDRVTRLYVIQTGEIELSRSTPQGSLITLQRPCGPSVVAEASLFSNHYHCDARAVIASHLYSVTRQNVLKELRSNAELSYHWNAGLAAEVQALRMRNEILRLRTVRDKLNAWLTWTDQPLPPKGRWNGVASEIGVSAEALYREIAARER